MTTPAVVDRRTLRRARVWNLLVPGAGLVLCGCAGLGVGVGLAFAVLANLAIVADFIAPDAFSTLTRAWVNGLALGVYFGAQVRLTGEVRRQREQLASDQRRGILRQAHVLLLSGDPEAAWDVLLPIAAEAEHDLVVAYRVAQVLLAKGDPGAGAAWALVRRLDRHRIYRDQIREAEARLRLSDHGRASSGASSG